MSKAAILPCYIIVGEWQIAKEKCFELSEKIIQVHEKENVLILEGDEITPVQVLEKLKTKGLFFTKQTVIAKELLFQTEKDLQGIILWVESQAQKDKLDKLLILFYSPEHFDKKILQPLIKKTNVIDLRPNKNRPGDIKGYIQKLIKAEGKSISPRALELFIDLVGTSSLTAIQKELEKLIFLIGDEDRISESNVETLVFRHKEEEIFKISDAITKRNLAQGLKSLNILLEQNISPIAILTTIRNTIFRIFALKMALSYACPDRTPKNFNEFKDIVWPLIKDKTKDIAISDYLRLHPYSAYLHLKAPYDLKELLELLDKFALLDLELKGGKVMPHLVIENFLLSFLRNGQYRNNG